jgi:YbbR domain-containing protein
MTLWPFRHLGLKVLSVALAVLLWMVVAGEETVERGIRIPLELQQFPAGLELQAEPPSTVDVRVRGQSGTLSRLTPGDLIAVLDLKGAQPGQRLFHVTPDQVRVPFGVEIVQVTPSTVALVLEKSGSKFVQVVPAVEGKPAAGFVVGKVVAEPDVVEVVGPESAVRRAAAALTEPVSVAGARADVRRAVSVGMLDSTLRLKASRQAVVDVRIEPAPLERAVHNLAVHLRNLAPHLTAQSTPSMVDVRIRGSQESLAELEADSITAFVDLAGLGAGSYTLTVRADTTREAGITRIEPDSVQVRIIGSTD